MRTLLSHPRAGLTLLEVLVVLVILALTTALVPYRPMGELAGRILMARIGGQFVHEPPPFPAPVAMRATTAAPPV